MPFLIYLGNSMSYKDYLGESYSEDSQEFNPEKAAQLAKQERGNLNIVLIGATGVGKSSLVNAMFGQNVVEAGHGEPVTQHLEKIHLPDKGITLWDTKGIESEDYKNTMDQLTTDLEKGFQEAFDSNQEDQMPHIAWLCIKESSHRIENREKSLLKLLQRFNIPTVVVFTNTMKSGDGFYKMAVSKLSEEFSDFLKQERFVRVNSIRTEIDDGIFMEPKGLDILLEQSELCLDDVNHNIQYQQKQYNQKKYKSALLRAQKVDINKRKLAMVESAKTAVHIAAAAAGTAGASPIPMSDAPIIAAIQTKMIYSINNYFEVDISNKVATATIMKILGITIVSQVGKAIVSNALKFLPTAGSLLGGAISGATAIALTEAIGFAYIQVMEKYFNEKTGRVELPAETAEILNVFKTFFKKP